MSFWSSATIVESVPSKLQASKPSGEKKTTQIHRPSSQMAVLAGGEWVM